MTNLHKSMGPGLDQAYNPWISVRLSSLIKCLSSQGRKQVAQWATIAHHRASIMFGDTIIYDAQRQVTLNLKQ